MKKRLFQHLPHTHILVSRQIGHQPGEALLNPRLKRHPLDFHLRFAHGNALTEPDHVLVGIPDVHLPAAPWIVRRTLNHVRAESSDSVKIIIHLFHENREPCSGMALAAEAKERGTTAAREILIEAAWLR